MSAEARRPSHLSAPIMPQVYSKHRRPPENPAWPCPVPVSGNETVIIDLLPAVGNCSYSVTLLCHMRTNRDRLQTCASTSFTYGFVEVIEDNERKVLKVSKTFILSSAWILRESFSNNVTALRKVFWLLLCVFFHVAVLWVCQETCWSGVCLKTWTWMAWSSKPLPAAPIESPQTSCECARRLQCGLMCCVHTGQRAEGFKDTLCLKRHARNELLSAFRLGRC